MGRKRTKIPKDMDIENIISPKDHKDLDYFVDFCKSFNPDMMRDSLNFSFVFNLIMVNLCYILKDHPCPRQFVNQIVNTWAKSMKKGFEPQIKKHADMLKTYVGSCLTEKVNDSEDMRIILNKALKDVIQKYKVPLTDLVNDIEKSRGDNQFS